MEYEVIFVVTIIPITLVVTFSVAFFLIPFLKSKWIRKQKERRQRIEQEITKSRLEIQEHSLKSIGWELHDNIGQLLSLARMQLNQMRETLPDEYEPDVSRINNLIGDSLQGIRLLSRTLNTDVVLNVGLIRSIECELERFNQFKILTAELSVRGEPVEIDRKDEIIIFRILQEFFSNVIKHSMASALIVSVDYEREHLFVWARDNGIGFDPQKAIDSGTGLINMQSRAHLIGADFQLVSSVDSGVELSLSYRYRSFH